MKLMIEIFQIDLTKEKLAAMPPPERQLLLLLGHASNEMNVFRKLILMNKREAFEHKLTDHVQAGQICILLRTLVGKLHEAWHLFVTRFQANHQMSAEYLPKLSQEAVDALEELKKHFGKNSPLTHIRNKFSFHYLDKENRIEARFPDIPTEEPWHFYLSETEGNCFYYASEMIVMDCVTNLATARPNENRPYIELQPLAFSDLCSLVISVSVQITILFGECITDIISENFSNLERNPPIKIVNAPTLDSIQIPFFTDNIGTLP